ncbi:MAG: class II histone deacetylase [Burkholderiales bacterium]|nr:class II histone deacetylase [Burkholderiales bacterium]
MSRTTAFFHDERCLWHSTGVHSLVLPIGGWVQPPAGGGHAESPESKRRFLSLMEVSGLYSKLDVRSGPMATEDDLRRVHPDDYLLRFKQASDAGGGDLGVQAPFGRGSYEIAKLSVGLVCAAIDSVLRGTHRNAYAMSRPPGHHCLPDQPMGFCLFANVAVAVEAAKAKHGLSRIAILDWDVHHGNGTQAVFYERPDVLTLSIHQDRCFPFGYSGAQERGAGKGLGYNYNIPMQAGGGDASYRDAFERIIVPALDRYRPELIVIASGLDANGFDPLARMQLHSESFRWMTQMMMQVADRHCGGKLVLAHEGGYAESYVPFCGHAIMEALSGERTAVEDPALGAFIAQQPDERFERFQRALIDELAANFGLN